MSDVGRLLGAELVPVSGSWQERDIILYHLAVGAGACPTAAPELELTYEPRLKVLPSFAATAAMAVSSELGRLPGLDRDWARRLHGEQSVELLRPLPLRAEVWHHGRVAAVYDKGTAAVLAVEVTTTDEAGAPIAVTRSSVFLRGAGGFGGERGPSTRIVIPDRPADVVVDCPTLPQQALLYRLTGDANPLHVDPTVARRVGFDRPILHGLCTYGIACRAAVQSALNGDVDRVGAYEARFTGVVYPGDRLVTSLWRADGGLLLEVRAERRNEIVLVGQIREPTVSPP